MKILIIQLARLGDIYMSWPMVRSLKRAQPGADIHMLVRQRFEAATTGLSELDKVVVLPNRSILEPLVQERFDLEASCCRLERFLDELEIEQYDAIINLSFSPLSSYLTHHLARPGVDVYGYTRHADGYLNFADEVSSYFHAQVGPGRANRSHLTDIFASMIGSTLVEDDYRAPDLQYGKPLPDNYVVVHIGASESHKRLEPSEYAQVISRLHREDPTLSILLIGAPHEEAIASEVLRHVPTPQVKNLVGQTQVPDLFPIIQGAEMLIGCDSAPIHVASLTNTMTLNLSLGAVNFWETGPKASSGFILRLSAQPQERNFEKVGEIAANLLRGQIDSSLIVRGAGLASYLVKESPRQQFAWKLAQAIYLGEPLPVVEDMDIYQALQHIHQVNSMLIGQYEAMTMEKLSQMNPLIEQTDVLLRHISRTVPEVSPLVEWLMTEKVRLGPGSFQQVRAATLQIHLNLASFLKSYIPQDEEGVSHGTV